MDLLHLNGYKSSSGDYNSVIYVVFILCFALFSATSLALAGFRPEYNEKKKNEIQWKILLSAVWIKLWPWLLLRINLCIFPRSRARSDFIFVLHIIVLCENIGPIIAQCAIAIHHDVWSNKMWSESKSDKQITTKEKEEIRFIKVWFMEVTSTIPCDVYAPSIW